MGDLKNETKSESPAALPTPPSAESSAEPCTSREETLQQARKFLQDTKVQNTTSERKAEFLRSKGLSDADIEELLKEVSQDARPESQTSSQIGEERIEPPLPKKGDRPPIVTYPEFLTKPARPPPLVTVNGFLNTLYAFGGLSALVYGASRYVVEPMVNTLTEARISLHDTAKQDLAKLVSKLESTVSEIPVPKPRPSSVQDDDAMSSYDDPTELFHQDVGVQTSLPPSPSPELSEPHKESATTIHTRRLTSLVASLRSLNEGLVDHTETLGDVQTVLDVLKQDLDKMTSAAAATDFVGGFSLYGPASKNEPDDEIKRAKENIRRVKGVLLSTRSFPASR
ncbi:peroxisomal membrane anchor protein conserved region-domain-containing protein [Achaetomium macrosporum]|uniref:Peroxisomal membrane protein PEX14 n=1 Tax=Achaetomium macrosporum TaxID=79813 RepID=A0AAN7HFS4_9PEZI|nr:peroxisomal membrane anchor protein conserved region-domain-containing protein [Achaetomium macrosporum]